jgi:putative transcriptional regulator
MMISDTDLLVAPPQMPDPRFRDSVIMITEHTDLHTLGVCVNRPLRQKLSDLVTSSDPGSLPNLDVYWGGPVAMTHLGLLHSTDWIIQDTQVINQDWAMTSSAEMLACISSGDCPRQFRLFLGFSAWAPGQLAAEIHGGGQWQQKHSWLMAKNLGAEWLFEQPVEQLWSGVVTLSCHQAVDGWL